MNQSSIREALRVLTLGKRKFSFQLLQQMLPDVETALFFAKVYSLDYNQTSLLLSELFNSSLVDTLFRGIHSEELQDFLVDLAADVPTHLLPENQGVKVDPAIVPKGEILPQLWDQAEIEIASSIQKVADKLFDTLDQMPAKYGRMTFQHLRAFNDRKPTMGTYNAVIQHPPVPASLVILDVSGSVSSPTVRALAEDVVALSYKANAHLAIVSTDTFFWEPGTFTVDDVLSNAQYGGTCYHTLAPLFQRDWGTVVTIADYDSAMSSYDAIKKVATGKVGTVLDISLVDRPTFLSECVGQLADEVRPLLVANTRSVLR